jgi:hypothetical protein
MRRKMTVWTKPKLVCGVGVNDADYRVTSVVNGSQEKCKFYSVWKSMISRCYSKKYQEQYPTYIGCTVCDEWLVFSKFKAWMELQDWQGRHLDKDILSPNNKVYSPDFCCFVSALTNTFVVDQKYVKQEYPTGTRYCKSLNKYAAHCSNFQTGKNEVIGIFSLPSEAHQAWRKRKHELACILADMQTDMRVADALRVRYSE